MHLDNLVEEIGSFGKFQIMVICMIMIPKLFVGYNMLLMTFGGYVPDWWCLDDAVTIRSNSTFKHCAAVNETCDRVYDNYTATIVTKWDLSCERKLIIPMITSIQFGGVLLGALVGGQAADMIGRKKTFYITLLLHSVFSIVIIFSISWQMFAVFRFFIGSTLGSYLVVSMFPVEFIGFRWRPILTLVPFWATGVCLLALVSWLLHDWVYVQLVAGLSTVPFLLGWFIIPESIRWLAIKGKIDEAEKAVEKVARINGKIKPVNTREILEKISEEELEKSKGENTYSYLDLYKSIKLAKRSIFLQLIWFFVSASYYGFAFGVGKFSGNFYLNLFLMNVLEFPFFIPVIFIMNRFGRRLVAVASFIGGALSCVAVIAVQKSLSQENDHRGTVITALSLTARIFTGFAWAAVIIIANEMYPTAIRNIGYGAANMAARVGGIVAPYIFSVSDDEMVPYIIVVVMLGFSGISAQLFIPETLGLALEDIIDASSSEPNTNTTEEKYQSSDL